MTAAQDGRADAGLRHIRFARHAAKISRDDEGWLNVLAGLFLAAPSAARLVVDDGDQGDGVAEKAMAPEILVVHASALTEEPYEEADPSFGRQGADWIQKLIRHMDTAPAWVGFVLDHDRLFVVNRTGASMPWIIRARIDSKPLLGRVIAEVTAASGRVVALGDHAAACRQRRAEEERRRAEEEAAAGRMTRLGRGLKGYAKARIGWREILWGGDQIGRLYRNALGREQRSSVGPETFEQAQRRLGLTEEKILRHKARFRNSFWIHVLGTAAMLGYALYMSFVADSGGDIMIGIASLCLSAALTAGAMRDGFRHWQLRKRRLGGFAEWLETPEEWVPR